MTESVAMVCELEPELWFSTKRKDVAAAVAACLECPMQAICKELGLAEEYGVWGGTTEADRRETVKASRRQEFNRHKVKAVAVSKQTALTVYRWHLLGDDKASLANEFGLSVKDDITIINNRGKAA